MGHNASIARHDVYGFVLDELGIKMNGAQHDKLRALLKANANAQAEDLLVEIANLKTALTERKKKNDRRTNGS